MVLDWVAVTARSSVTCQTRWMAWRREAVGCPWVDQPEAVPHCPVASCAGAAGACPSAREWAVAVLRRASDARTPVRASQQLAGAHAAHHESEICRLGEFLRSEAFLGEFS